MATQTWTQTRSHAGHSHHHHHHDNTYLLSNNKNDAGVRITKIGLYVNLAMALGKGAGGYYFNSQALSADAAHSFADLISDFVTLATVSWSTKRPSTKFPGGYGKVESLGSLTISALLLITGAQMGLTALTAIGSQVFPEFFETISQLGLLGHGHGHSHGHGIDDLGPNINAAWLAAGSIAIKEWLYRATLKVAKERKSSVLAANAYHHRIDSLTALVALFMIVGSNFLSNASWMDPVGGLIISLMVVQAGYGNTKQAILELTDVGVDEEMTTNVREKAAQALEREGLQSSVEVRNVQGVKSGQNYLMDVELAAPKEWNLTKTKEVESLVRASVGEKIRGVKRVRVRFVTAESSPVPFDEFVNFDSQNREPEEEHNHDLHDHDHDHSHQQKQANGQPNGISKRR